MAKDGVMKDGSMLRLKLSQSKGSSGACFQDLRHMTQKEVSKKEVGTRELILVYRVTFQEFRW